MGFDKYFAKMRAICNELMENDFVGDICFLSSVALCLSNCGEEINEESAVYVRNEYDLALATGEHLLSVLACRPSGYGVQHIMRLGVVYGNETGIQETPGFLNKILKSGKSNQDIRIPKPTDALRSFTHVSDVCDAVIELMLQDSSPSIINIPGEDLSIKEVAQAVARHYKVKYTEAGACRYDDLDFHVENQNISKECFCETVDFSPRYTF